MIDRSECSSSTLLVSEQESQESFVTRSVSGLLPPTFGTAETTSRPPDDASSHLAVLAPDNSFITAEFLHRVIDGRNLREDIIAADAQAQCVGGLFNHLRSLTIEALASAYPVFLHLRSGCGDAFDTFLDHPFFKENGSQRKRKPSRSNLALLAIEFVARPSHEADRKTCSDYSTVLLYAASKCIAPCDFVEDMIDVPLQVAKKYVRDQRRAAKNIKAKMDPPPKSSQLATSFSCSRPICPSGHTQASLSLILQVPGSKDLETSFSVDPEVLTELCERLISRSSDALPHDFLLNLAAAFETIAKPPSRSA